MVPSKTVVRTGRCNQEGMEEAEVKGKGKGDVKIWHCVLLPQAAKKGEEDIRVKLVKRSLDQSEDSVSGPIPAKKRHTSAGKC